MAGGCSVGWLDLLVGWLVGGWLIGWLVAWLLGCLVAWVFGCLGVVLMP